MTRDEAIFVLEHIEAHGGLVIKAKEMAIKALEQEPKTGYWVDSEVYLLVVIGDTVVHLPAKECSICHKPHIKGYGADYCPNCGAKMEKGGKHDKV